MEKEQVTKQIALQVSSSKEVNDAFRKSVKDTEKPGYQVRGHRRIMADQQIKNCIDNIIEIYALYAESPADEYSRIVGVEFGHSIKRTEKTKNIDYEAIGVEITLAIQGYFLDKYLDSKGINYKSFADLTSEE